jgi:hypothetical protein
MTRGRRILLLKEIFQLHIAANPGSKIVAVFLSEGTDQCVTLLCSNLAAFITASVIQPFWVLIHSKRLYPDMSNFSIGSVWLIAFTITEGSGISLTNSSLR